jgi:carboxylesterase type B
MNIFILSNYPNITPQQLAEIDSMYPPGPQYPNQGLYWPTVSAAYGEMRYICPGIYISQAYSQYIDQSWNYHYDVQDPTLQAEGYGVTHTVEVNAIWGPNYVSAPAPASYTEDSPFVAVMQGYWTSFIRTYDPNIYRANGSAVWNEWRPNEKRRILIQNNGTSMETVPLDQQDRCNYLSGIALSINQ